MTIPIKACPDLLVHYAHFLLISVPCLYLLSENLGILAFENLRDLSNVILRQLHFKYVVPFYLVN